MVNDACKVVLAEQHESCKMGSVTLREYIESKGDQAAADLFGVPVRTVMSWRLGDRMPRPKTAQLIVERTEGEVSMNDIYLPVAN